MTLTDLQAEIQTYKSGVEDAIREQREYETYGGEGILLGFLVRKLAALKIEHQRSLGVALQQTKTLYVFDEENDFSAWLNARNVSRLITDLDEVMKVFGDVLSLGDKPKDKNAIFERKWTNSLEKVVMIIRNHDVTDGLPEIKLNLSGQKSLFTFDISFE